MSHSFLLIYRAWYMNKKSRLFLSVAIVVGTLSVSSAIAQQQAAPAAQSASPLTGGATPPTAAQQGLTLPVQNNPAPAPSPGYYGTQVPQVTAPVVQSAPQASSANSPPSVPPTALPPLPVGSNAAEMDALSDQYMGVTPQQIKEMRKQFDERQKANSQPIKAPKPVTGSVTVSLSPGSTPPVIRPYLGNITSLVVLDSTGAPWPVENFRVGDEATFPVERLDGPQGSAFTIDANYQYGQSNLVLKLAGVSSPVVINLVAGQAEHDARVEIRVQGRGPNAVVTSGNLIRGTNSDLMPVLDGISPPGGKPVKVSGLEDIRAWILPDGKLMVKSPYRIASPATPTFLSSADGTTVYVFSPTTKLMAFVDGNFVDLSVTGW